MSERIRRPPPRRGSPIPGSLRRPPPIPLPLPTTSRRLASPDFTGTTQNPPEPTGTTQNPPEPIESSDREQSSADTSQATGAAVAAAELQTPARAADHSPATPPLPPRPRVPLLNNGPPEQLNVETLRRLLDDPNFDFNDFFAHFDFDPAAVPAAPPPPPCIGECQIHFEEVALDPPACCKFGVCAECFTTYTRLHVSEGNIKIRCPNPACKSLMSREEIRLKLDAALKLKYDQFLVDANRDPHTKTCPRCSHITSDGAAVEAAIGALGTGLNGETMGKGSGKGQGKRQEKEEGPRKGSRKGLEEGGSKKGSGAGRPGEEGENEAEVGSGKRSRKLSEKESEEGPESKSEKESRKETGGGKSLRKGSEKEAEAGVNGAGVVKGVKVSDAKKKKYGLRICCTECQLEWCFPCQAPWHAGITCQEYRKGDKLVKKWAKSQDGAQFNAHRCPKCKIFIQRSTGCDHMQCTQCQTEFCYRCGERRRGLKYLQLLVGKHDGKFGVMGCKYSYKPDKPAQRRLTRGALLCAKLAAIPVALGLAVAVLPIALVVLPVGYGVVRARRALRERRISRILVDWRNVEEHAGRGRGGEGDAVPHNRDLFFQLLREAGVDGGEGERGAAAGGGDEGIWDWGVEDDVEVEVEDLQPVEDMEQYLAEYAVAGEEEDGGAMGGWRPCASTESGDVVAIEGEAMVMAVGGGEGAAGENERIWDGDILVASKGVASTKAALTVLEDVRILRQGALGERTGRNSSVGENNSDRDSCGQDDVARLTQTEDKLESASSKLARKEKGHKECVSLAAEEGKEKAVKNAHTAFDGKEKGEQASSTALSSEIKSRKSASPLRTSPSDERTSYFLSLESVDDDLEQALRNLRADIDKLAGDHCDGAGMVSDRGAEYQGVKVPLGFERQGDEDPRAGNRGVKDERSGEVEDLSGDGESEHPWNPLSLPSLSSPPLNGTQAPWDFASGSEIATAYSVKAEESLV